MANLPEEFCDAMRHLLGEEYSAYLESFQQKSHTALRVNTNKITLEEWEKICPFSGTQVPWTEKGRYYDPEEVQPAKHPYYFAGLYYIQEPSAMIPAELLPVKPGDRVLDLCAAPGGKATEIAAKLQGQGLLLANDISVSRAMGLAKNLQMAGAVNAVVTAETPEHLAECFGEYFDGILVDAPCSGEGMFRRDARMIREWMEHGPDYYREIQKEILGQAYRMLRPGGYLLYSTCTFSLQENEGVVGWLLSEYEDMHICPVKRHPLFSQGRPDMAAVPREEAWDQAVRIFPHKAPGEGHFAVLLQKDPVPGGEEVDKKWDRDKKNKPFPFLDSLSEDLLVSWMRRTHLCGEDADSLPDGNRICSYRDQLILMPELLPMAAGLRFIQSGLILGTVKRGRFEPSPQLALAVRDLSALPVLQLSAEDERVLRYLRGETLEAEDIMREELLQKTDAYLLVCVRGFPLGWAKAAGNGRIKNKYHAGWRLQ